MAFPSTGIIEDAPATGYHGDLIGGGHVVRGGYVRGVALAAGALALLHSNGPNDEENVKGVANNDVIGPANIAGFCIRNESFDAGRYGVDHQVEIARKGRMRAVATSAVSARDQVYVGNTTATLGQFAGAPGVGLVPLPGARWEAAVAEDALGIIEFDFAPVGNRNEGTLPAFAAAALAVPANPPDGAIYALPATAANSVVTLPADTEEKVTINILADGVLNAHTVQYRDETGAVNLTAALTDSKRHYIRATFLGGKWHALVSVAP